VRATPLIWVLLQCVPWDLRSARSSRNLSTFFTGAATATGLQLDSNRRASKPFRDMRTVTKGL